MSLLINPWNGIHLGAVNKKLWKCYLGWLGLLNLKKKKYSLSILCLVCCKKARVLLSCNIVAPTDFGSWSELQRDAISANDASKNSDGRQNSYQKQKSLQ